MYKRQGLQPLQLYRYVNAGMKDELERFNLEDCMECGCCSYVCPGRLPLVETFKAGKKLLKDCLLYTSREWAAFRAIRV